VCGAGSPPAQRARWALSAIASGPNGSAKSAGRLKRHLACALHPLIRDIIEPPSELLTA
jgi:hypothetical protein